MKLKRIFWTACLALVALGAAFGVALGARTMFENAKCVVVTWPASVDNATATSVKCDTLGYTQASFILTLGANGTTVNAKLQESNTAGSGYADIDDAELTEIATGVDSCNYAIDVNLAGRMRYLKPVVQAGPGACVLSAIIILHGPGVSPASATEAGLAEHVKL